MARQLNHSRNEGPVCTEFSPAVCFNYPALPSGVDGISGLF